ncbi:MAG: TolC family protein [Bacteroidales bacterium]|nr:TolC family protein [Bacteroidales bacterium]
MKRFVVITLMLLAATATRAQEAPQATPWTLQDCTNYALDHSLTVQKSALQVNQREIDLGTARARLLPGVSANASQNFSFGRGLTADNTYANTNTTNTGLSLGADMTLFNGLRNRNNIELSKLNLQAATRDLEKARDDIRVAVAKAYVQILYNEEILAVARRQVEIDSLQVIRLEAMRDNGKAAEAEVARQAATLAQSRLTAVQASNNLHIALLEMTQLLELPSPEGFTVASPVHQEPELPLTSPEAIYEEAIGIKPAVKAEETRLAYAERNIALAKGGYMPTLSLSGGLGTNYYTSSGYPHAAFFTQLSNNFSQYVGLSLSIPIFSRMSNRNQVRSAKVSYQVQQVQLDQTKKQLYKDIQQAWYNAVAAHEKFKSSLEAEKAAAQSLTLVQAKYENGKATITEFNESKTQYLKAASDLAQARCEALYQSGLIDFYRGKEIQL